MENRKIILIGMGIGMMFVLMILLYVHHQTRTVKPASVHEYLLDLQAMQQQADDAYSGLTYTFNKSSSFSYNRTATEDEVQLDDYLNRQLINLVPPSGFKAYHQLFIKELKSMRVAIDELKTEHQNNKYNDKAFMKHFFEIKNNKEALQKELMSVLHKKRIQYKTDSKNLVDYNSIKE